MSRIHDGYQVPGNYCRYDLRSELGTIVSLESVFDYQFRVCPDIQIGDRSSGMDQSLVTCEACRITMVGRRLAGV